MCIAQIRKVKIQLKYYKRTYQSTDSKLEELKYYMECRKIMRQSGLYENRYGIWNTNDKRFAKL